MKFGNGQQITTKELQVMKVEQASGSKYWGTATLGLQLKLLPGLSMDRCP